MSNDEFNQQSLYYNTGYLESHLSEMGFPDLKIVDFDKDIKNKKILSIGGGNGSDIWFLAKENEVQLVDSSEVAIKQGQKHGVKAQVIDVSKGLPFADDYFDIIILKDILEHVYDPMALFLEAKRTLNPNGYIILSLPNHFYLPFRLRILFGSNLIWKSLLHDHRKDFAEWNYMHIRFFTWKGVKQMLRQTNFKIVKAYWDFGTWAHYSDPEMYEYAFKINNKKIVNKRQWLMYKVLIPSYNFFNFIFPKKLRVKIVSLAPGLLCAGFYLKIKKEKK